MTEIKNRYLIIKKINLVIFCSFYIVAGINHFWHPQLYLDLIPPYLPKKDLVNIISGWVEVVAGTGMIFSFTRRSSAIFIIALLIMFIPAHVYMIQLKGCISEKICIPEWVAWIRLIPFQFILMLWAWKTYKWSFRPIKRNKLCG